MTFLYGFKLDSDVSRLRQKKSLEWSNQIRKNFGWSDDELQALMKYQVSEASILYRQSYLPDMADAEYCDALPSANEKRAQIFNSNNLFRPNLNQRAQVANEVISEIFARLFAASEKIESDLLHVSCTHYQSPSAAQKLVSQRNLQSSTHVTHLYHMGCYAAFPALRVARGLSQQRQSTVDVVHTELCSFHFDPAAKSAEQTVVQSLFSDGAITYKVSALKDVDSLESKFNILTVDESLIPQTEHLMSWSLGASNFIMTLSPRVAVVIKESLRDFVLSLAMQADLAIDDVLKNSDFAIHPGGPKIIDSCKEALELSDEQVYFSRSVLKNYGNMSSSTLPFVWNEILQQGHKPFVCSLGFGPGLTIAGAIFKRC